MPLPPFLVIRSRPWSKNWPKNVKKLLDGADRPLSGVMLGMNRLCGRPGIVDPLLEALVGVARLPNVDVVGGAHHAVGAGERRAGVVGRAVDAVRAGQSVFW